MFLCVCIYIYNIICLCTGHGGSCARMQRRMLNSGVLALCNVALVAAAQISCHILPAIFPKFPAKHFPRFVLFCRNQRRLKRKTWGICIYIFVCMYVYVHTQRCVCVCGFNLFICLYVNIYWGVHIYINAYGYMYMYQCMDVCLCVIICICVCMYIHM